MNGELLDSGYQKIYALYDVRIGELEDWLKNELIGFADEETGDEIVGIDHFQILGGTGPYYSCIVLVRVARKDTR